MRRLLPALRVLSFAALAQFLLEIPALAEPYIAVREGYKCSQCHVNRSGGGMRNAFGSVYAQAFLPASGGPQPKLDEPYKLMPPGQTESPRRFLTRDINPWISLGGDLRANWNTVIRQKDDTNDYGINEGQLFLEGRPQEGRLTLYLDERVAPTGANSREAVAILHQDDWDGLYLKAGRMMPSYGLRLFDDLEFVRASSGFNYGNQDFGSELGWEPGPFTFIGGQFNGTNGGAEDNRTKQYVGQAIYTQRRLRLGLSVSSNRGKKTLTSVAGGFAGLNVGRYTFLCEADQKVDLTRASNKVVRQNMVFGELDVLLTRGWNLKTTFGGLDPDSTIDGDDRSRYRTGLEWFPWPGFQVSAFYINNLSIPQDRPGNNDIIFLEFHLFF